MQEIFRMIGRYEDGHEARVANCTEELCMYDLIELMDAHGQLVWYSIDLDYEEDEE